MNYTNIFSIIKKELQQTFNNPASYIVMVVILLLWEFLFFRNAFIVGVSSLRGMLSYFPWLAVILVPAITMGSIAEEKSNGTLEFLLTRPIRSIELILGKWLANVIFVSIIGLAIFPVAISFSQFAPIDWGAVTAQYIAIVLLGAVLSAVGVFASSLLQNQISALLVSVAISFALIIIGTEFVTASVPFQVANVLEQLSVTTHFNSMVRGVIDIRDVWYALSATVTFLGLAHLQLLRRLYGNQLQAYRTYQLTTYLFIGIAILTNVLGSRIPGRIDLTENQLFTLSPATVSTLQNLDDVVNIVVYASEPLPAQFQPTLRETKDILRDYQTTSKEDVIVTYKNPSKEPQIAEEAASTGITQVEFNVIGQEELQLKRGYFGIAVNYGAESEIIPFVDSTTDLEYQLTSYITKLTDTDKQTVGFLTDGGAKSSQEIGILAAELVKQFEIQDVSLTEETPTISEEISVLVIAGPTAELSETTINAVSTFIDSGKSAFIMADGVTVQPELLSGTANVTNINTLLEKYGVQINSDLIYDLRSNETVNFGGSAFSYLIPYPLWPVALASDESSSLTAQIPQIIMPWPSSLALNESKIEGLGFKLSKVFSTSQYAGTLTEAFSITPDQEFPQTDLGTQTVAISLSGGEKENSAQRSRIIIVGNSSFLIDDFVSNAPENIGFGMEAISWLTQEESLADIQLKQRTEPQLLFEDETQMSLVRYGNLGLVTLLPIAYALYRLNRRKSLRTQRYHG